VIRTAAVCAAASICAGAALLLTGCGSSSSAGGCKDVPLGTNNEVSSSLETGFAVDDFKAVKSSNDVWFVSAKATGPSGEVTYPIWITKDLGGGPVYLGDHDSSNVTPGLKKISGVSMSDDAVQKAKDCSRKAAEEGS
jgi:hypothetical protein